MEFAKQGAKLVLSARRVEELERVTKQTGLPDAQVLILPMEVTDFAKVPTLAALLNPICCTNWLEKHRQNNQC